MAGAIDIHSHIAGGNVNTARLLLPENHRAHVARPAETPLSTAGWSTFETGCRYAAMGFTTVIEPAVPTHTALHSHLELADMPIIDKGILAVVGEDDFLLTLLRDAGKNRTAIADYLASALAQTKGLGIKSINPGGSVAFADNARTYRSRRCRAVLWCQFASDHPGVAARRDGHRHRPSAASPHQ